MGFESFPQNNVSEIKTEKDFDIEEALEKPEKLFAEVEASKETVEESTSIYETILLNQESIIGMGNAGVVFNESEHGCFKAVWNQADVEIKGKRFDLLPPKLQRLRNVQDYFTEINSKKRLFIQKGLSFEPDNKPLQEAGLQITAREILKQKGLEKMIPEFYSITHIKNEDEGEVDSFPYDTREDVYLMNMKKVNGENVESFILNYPDNEEVLANIDLDIFENDLKESLSALHEKGLFHKDLSLRNVMINFKTGWPVLIDFGKSIYKSDGASEYKETELQHLSNIITQLRQYKLQPEVISKKLTESYQKQAERL